MTMDIRYKKMSSCAEFIRSKTQFVPKVALVLGSGLGGFASNMKVEVEVPYSEIEGFPVSTVPGHEGSFLFGYVGEVPIVAMNGRVHYYEGYDISDVVLPIRVMFLLGAEILILTNAAGGINLDFKPGDLMAITDHVGTFVPSPLRGANIDELGTRFPDMSKIYDPEILELLKEVGEEEGIDLKEGVYIQAPGPQYETPAEIRMMRILGASVVGMSTTIEATAARHMGMRVCGISCVTNMAAGILDQPLSHEEVFETANIAGEKFQRLVKGLICKLA